MGYLDLSDQVSRKASKVVEDALNSKFSTYLRGMGTPVLVTYYKIDKTISTTELGTNTIDQQLGPNSPLRFNRIDNFPVVGLKEFNPSIEQMDGQLMDLSIEMEITIYPNTIKPDPFDYIVYRINSRNFIFMVTGFEFNTIKSNDYYKINIILKDIDNDDYPKMLELQTIKYFRAKLDTIGTEERCILESRTFDSILEIDDIRKKLTDEYADVFYDTRLNSIYYTNDTGVILYDPYVTKFFINNDLFDTRKHNLVLVNYDRRPSVEVNYRKSLFYNLEEKSISTVKLKQVLKLPATFETTHTNPFSLYGLGNVFTLDLELFDESYSVDASLFYMGALYEYIENKRLINHRNPIECVPVNQLEYISGNGSEAVFKGTSNPITRGYIYWNLIVNYLCTDLHDLLENSYITKDILKELVISNTYEDFLYAPTLFFILKKYTEYLSNSSKITFQGGVRREV